jgi:hypothetical protein
MDRRQLFEALGATTAGLAAVAGGTVVAGQEGREHDPYRKGRCRLTAQLRNVVPRHGQGDGRRPLKSFEVEKRLEERLTSQTHDTTRRDLRNQFRLISD